MRVVVTQPSAGAARIGALMVARQAALDGHAVRFAPWSSSDPQLTFEFVLSGQDISRIPTPDAWFVSVLGHRDWWELGRVRERLGVAPIVVGGQCADLMTPWAAGIGIDLVVVGDLHAPDRARVYEAAASHQQATIVLSPPDRLPDPIVMSGRRLLVLLSSGCARGCPYCRIASAHQRLNADLARTIAAIKAFPGTLVNLYSPSGDHPALEALTEVCRAVGKLTTNRDFHPRRALSLIRHGHRLSGRIRIGVEGVSERLRDAMGRRLRWEEIDELMRAGSTHQYYLVGTPGETAADFAEHRAEYIACLRRSAHVHWVTMGTLTPIPGTRWAGINGHWSDETAAQIARFKRELVALNTRGIRAILATARSRALHECEVVTMRAAVAAPGKMPAFLRAMSPAAAHDDRWRDMAERAGLNTEGLLCPVAPSPIADVLSVPSAG